jgi:hypothetical protein
VQQNFPIKTGETAFLFLQHFIKKLRAGGRAAIVIKNTFLSNSDNAARSLRRERNRGKFPGRWGSQSLESVIQAMNDFAAA